MSVVADQPQLDHRVALGTVVPIDYLAWVRRTALTCFCVYAIVLDPRQRHPVGPVRHRTRSRRLPGLRVHRSAAAAVGHPRHRPVAVLRDVVRVRDHPRRGRRQGVRDQVPAAGRGSRATSTASCSSATTPTRVLQDHFWTVDDALVRQGRLAHVLHALHLRPDRDGCALGDDPSSVGPLHEAVRDRARRRLRDVHRLPHRAAVDGGEELPPASAADPQRRSRLHCDGTARRCTSAGRTRSTGATPSRPCRRCTPRSR